MRNRNITAELPEELLTELGQKGGMYTSYHVQPIHTYVQSLDLLYNHSSDYYMIFLYFQKKVRRIPESLAKNFAM